MSSDGVVVALFGASDPSSTLITVFSFFLIFSETVFTQFHSYSTSYFFFFFLFCFSTDYNLASKSQRLLDVES